LAKFSFQSVTIKNRVTDAKHTIPLPKLNCHAGTLAKPRTKETNTQRFYEAKKFFRNGQTIGGSADNTGA
jgi:hypothetical protein